MVTLDKLNLADTMELHQRLGRRWRLAGNDPIAKRTYRLMCRVFIRDAMLRKQAELLAVYRDMMSA